MDTLRRVIFYTLGLFLLGGMFLLERQDQASVQSSVNSSASSSNPNAPVVALTFDDGPHSRYTEELLDGLAERNVKATFFLIGCNVEGKEELVQRMQNEGHLIGSHTYNHTQLTTLSEEDALAEIARCNALLESITGIPTTYIRPPYGSWNSSWSDALNMQVVLWDVDPEDWNCLDTDTVVNRILNNVSDGDIILLHDIYQTSVEAALQVVDILQSQGYQFARVDELLLD
jgi:peptidoglycan/xylan/chitin deacetylase (PgdA/CDA1 family)